MFLSNYSNLITSRFSCKILVIVTICCVWAFCVSGVRAASQDGIDSNVKCTAALVVKDIRAIGAEIEGDVHLLSKGRSMYAAGTCHAGALYLPGTPKLRIPGRGWRCWWIAWTGQLVQETRA